MVPTKRPPSPSPGQEGSSAKQRKWSPIRWSASPVSAGSKVEKTTNVVRLLIYQVNGRPFERSLSKKEIKDIWLGLGRKLEEVGQVRTLVVKGKGCRLNYTLHFHIKITEISRHPELTLEKKNDQLLTEVYKIRLVYYDTAASEIGQVATAQLSKPDDISPDDIKDWLQCFGELRSDLRTYTDENGALTDDFEIDILLREHIVEVLPIKGRRIRIYYLGIPRLCNNCFGTGHIRMVCTNPKVTWRMFVSKLYHSGHFEEQMFGSWIKELREPSDSNLAINDNSTNGWKELTWGYEASASAMGRAGQAAPKSSTTKRFHGWEESGHGRLRHLRRQES